MTLAGGSMTFCNYHEVQMCGGQPETAVLPYAEEPRMAVPPAGKRVEVDCSGLQCPGPIKRLKDEMDKLEPGDELCMRATDPGFASDAQAWCLRNGHAVLERRQDKAVMEVRLQKGGVSAGGGGLAVRKDKKTFVVFSGELDKVMAAFVIANGALSMGSEVTMFFTFWGINVLRKSGSQAAGKGLLDRMFGLMMPKGPAALKLSNLNMGGMGTALMKYVMKSKRVDQLPALIASARAAGAKLVVCSMSMDVMGIKREELVEGLEIGGVASFLGEADESNVTLFI
jgi:peroxiredoxin family protein/TusA-related sulfurtransferase